MSHRMTKMRRKLSEAQNHRCAYCGVQMELHWLYPTPWTTATIDHVVPRSKGGSDAWENLVSACLRCNWLRGNMRAQKFASLMRSGNNKRTFYKIRHIQRLRSQAKDALGSAVVA